MTRSIILMSGGLDSVVSFAVANAKHNIELALTFDYGQKSVTQEIEASKNICNYYKIKHKIIKLDWLREITHTALVSGKDVPVNVDLENPKDSAKSVWVPNRNGLFLNIAASFADSENYEYIIIGANKEEAATFSDNTQKFIDSVNSEFEYSTEKHPKVLAPLINFDKNDIVKKALEYSVPLELIWSCYSNKDSHCGVCESCLRLKRALIANGDNKYLNLLFKKS